MGGKAKEQKLVVWHDVGVVDQVLFTSPQDFLLPPTLARTSPPIDWPVLVLINNGDRRERLWVELVTFLGLLHARADGVEISARAVDHEEEDCRLQFPCLFPFRSWRVAHGVGWDLR